MDSHGAKALPAPPSLCLLEDTRREKLKAETEIFILQEALVASENQCRILAHEVKSLRYSSECLKAEIKAFVRSSRFSCRFLYMTDRERPDHLSEVSTTPQLRGGDSIGLLEAAKQYTLPFYS